jgi:hypothetical protein
MAQDDLSVNAGGMRRGKRKPPSRFAAPHGMIVS